MWGFLYLFIIIIGFFSFVITILFFYRMAKKQLTNFEAGIFSVVTAVTLSAITLLISMNISNRNTSEELKRYGKLAMRRLVHAIDGCDALKLTIKGKQDNIKSEDSPNKEVVEEYLDNIFCQVSRLREGILDSKEDWSDILKNEREKAEEISLEYSTLLTRHKDLEKELAKTRDEYKIEKANKTNIEKKIKDLAVEIAKTNKELDKKIKEINFIKSDWPVLPAITNNLILDGALDIQNSKSFLTDNITSSKPLLEMGACVDCGNETWSKCISCGRFLCLDCGIKNSKGEVLRLLGKCKDCLEKEKGENHFFENL